MALLRAWLSLRCLRLCRAFQIYTRGIRSEGTQAPLQAGPHLLARVQEVSVVSGSP